MVIFKALRTIVVWGWSPILLTALAIIGAVYEWEIWMVASSMGVILIIGLVTVIIKSGENQLEGLSLRLRQLTGHFNRRFTGTSSLSIFAVIDTLFAMDDPQLWDWARACDMSARIYTTWCDSFVNRIESDTRTGKFRIYLRSYINELWLLNNHYYEFIEQFYEIAEKIDVPPATKDQYNRFAAEYNNFVNNFRDCVAIVRKAGGTEIEPPSINHAQELPGARPVRTFHDEESYF